MPKHGKVAYAEISVFAHATEDPEKVMQATKNLFPNMQEKMKLASTEMQGHHGNIILSIKGELVREDTLEALDLLLTQLSTLDEDGFRREFPTHIDPKGSLYLRLDKQQAFQGRVSLGTNDPISLKVRLGFKPKSLDELKVHLEKNKRSGKGDRRIGQRT